MTERRAAILTVYRPADGTDCTNGGLSSQATEILAVEGEVLPADEARGRPIFKVGRKPLTAWKHGSGAVQTGEHVYLYPYIAELLPQFAHGGNFAWSCMSGPRGWWGDRPLPIHDHRVAR